MVPTRACLLSILLLIGACSQAPADLAGAPAAGSAEAPGPAATPSAPATPEQLGDLRFDRIRHDFGRVSDLEQLDTTFAFTNVGDEEVHIQGVKASCGCTTPTLERDRFAPGEGHELAVHWKPKGFGVQTQTLTVRSDALPGGIAQLSITGEVVPFVRADPAQVRFDSARIHEPHLARTTLSCLDPTWTIENIESTSPHFEAAIVEDKPDGSRVLEVRLRESAPWGPNFGSLKVTAVGRPTPDAEPVRKVHDVRTYALVYAEVIPDRGMISVGKIKPGAQVNAELVLSRPGGGAFEVLSARIENARPPGLRVEIEPRLIGSRHQRRLLVRGDTANHLGTISGQLVFTTDVPGEGTRSIRIAGNVSDS